MFIYWLSATFESIAIAASEADVVQGRVCRSGRFRRLTAGRGSPFRKFRSLSQT
jgi:hypothetical protein